MNNIRIIYRYSLKIIKERSAYYYNILRYQLYNECWNVLALLSFLNWHLYAIIIGNFLKNTRKQFAKWASQKFLKVDWLCIFPRLFQTAEITTDNNRVVWVNFEERIQASSPTPQYFNEIFDLFDSRSVIRISLLNGELWICIRCKRAVLN